MRFALVLLMALLAGPVFSIAAGAADDARDLARSCRSLERGTRGTGQHIRIPNTKDALSCWNYMQAMQDMSVLVDENGHRLIGACPPEQTTTLQLIRSFLDYAESHPSKIQGNAAATTIEAFQHAFPCPRDSASAADAGAR